MTPNRSPPFSHATFTAAMKAYDDALQSLSSPSERTRDELATRIMHLAESGERDPLKLRDDALTHVGALIAAPAPEETIRHD